MSAPQVVTDRAVTSDGDDLLHTVCLCTPDAALCGADVSGVDWADDGLECVVCEDLDEFACPECGE